MESWYGLLWQHKNRHSELLKRAERDRLLNKLLERQRSGNPSMVSLLGLATLAVLAGVLRIAWGTPESSRGSG
jgi:hypothetical protein